MVVVIWWSSFADKLVANFPMVIKLQILRVYQLNFPGRRLNMEGLFFSQISFQFDRVLLPYILNGGTFVHGYCSKHMVENITNLRIYYSTMVHFTIENIQCIHQIEKNSFTNEGWP